jgi:hypothetical protein
MSVDVMCTYIIQSRTIVRGKVWWRRSCKRLAEPGTDRCWQHRRSP